MNPGVAVAGGDRPSKGKLMSERKGRRGGGRAARQELRAQGNTETIPYLERQIPPMSVLDEASLVQLEENAEIIMSEVGIAFQEFPLALELFAEAGCTIEGDLVKFPKGLARKIVTDNAPATYIQHARNPERNVKIGGNSTVVTFWQFGMIDCFQ